MIYFLLCFLPDTLPPKKKEGVGSPKAANPR